MFHRACRPTTTRRRLRPWVRGLGPPAFITCVGLTLIVYRTRTPDWRGLRIDERPAPAVAQAPPKPSAPPAPKIVARVEVDPMPFPPFWLPPPPPPAPAVAIRPEPEPKPEPEPQPEAVPPPLPRFAEPKAPEPVAAAEALADIRRAANRVRAERERMEAVKARSEARDREDARRRQAEQAERLQAFAHEDRVSFRFDLRQAVSARGDRAGQEIQDLCDRHGRSMPAPVKRQFIRIRAELVHRLGRGARIAAYRNFGVPEAVILDELATEESQKIGGRDGPRSRAEALVWASRILLKFPPSQHSPVADASGPPGRAPADRPR